MLLNRIKLFKVLAAGWLKVNLPLTLIWAGFPFCNISQNGDPAENALDLDRQIY